MAHVSRTSSDLKARDEKIIELAKQGCSFPEICDIMGLDQRNASKWRQMIKDAGAGLTTRPWLPKGVADLDPRFRGQLRELVHKLREEHSQPVVSEMLGLCNKELLAVTGGADGTLRHNWTVGQLKRLADAHGMTFEQLMCKVMGLIPDPKRTNYGFA